MKLHHLYLSVRDEALVVAPERLAMVMQRLRTCPWPFIVVPKAMLLPENLENYLLAVINMNRHTSSTFAFPMIDEEPFTRKGLWRLVRSQLACIEMDDHRCFSFVAPLPAQNLWLCCHWRFFRSVRDQQNRFLFLHSSGRMCKLL